MQDLAHTILAPHGAPAERQTRGWLNLRNDPFDLLDATMMLACVEHGIQARIGLVAQDDPRVEHERASQSCPLRIPQHHPVDRVGWRRWASRTGCRRVLARATQREQVGARTASLVATNGRYRATATPNDIAPRGFGAPSS